MKKLAAFLLGILLTGSSQLASAAFNPASVIESKDSSRSNVSLTAEAVAGATSEALITLTQSTAFATATTGTSFSVPTGKTFRITTIILSFISTTTTANTSRIRLRVNTAGAALVTSTVAYDARLAWQSATFIANEGVKLVIPLNDGVDVPAGSGVGVTHLEAAANGTVDLSVMGFLY